MEKTLKLNLGCGTTILPGYVNVDMIENEHIKPDIKADVTKALPFDDNSVDEIMASHIVEHFRVWRVKEILSEWRRILKVGGKLIIECPDLDKAIQNFTKYPNDVTMHMWALYGDPNFKEDSMIHCWAYNPKTLGDILTEVGFAHIKEEIAVIHDKPNRDFRLECYKPDVVIPLQQNRLIFTTDDLCPSNLQYFYCWDEVHKKYPGKRLIAFTIANKDYKENVSESQEFKDWYEKHKDWVEIAVHGYDHTYPPEAERDDFEECVEKALAILKPFLPKEYGYRSPGFQFSVRIEPVLKKLGFSYIAYRDHIKYFDGRFAGPLLNTHCCDEQTWENPITNVWRTL